MNREKHFTLALTIDTLALMAALDTSGLVNAKLLL